MKDADPGLAKTSFFHRAEQWCLLWRLAIETQYTVARIWRLRSSIQLVIFAPLSLHQFEVYAHDEKTALQTASNHINAPSAPTFLSKPCC